MTSPRLNPFLALAFGILAVSTASVFIRFAHGYAPSLVIAAWRLTLAAVALAPIAFTQHQGELRSLTRSDFGLALASGIFLALHFASWITSLEYTSIASSVVLVTTTPLWVALVSPLILKESVTKRAWIGMGIALLGGIVIGISDAGPSNGVNGTNPLLGDFLAIFGAWMAACYVIIGRRLRVRISLGGYTFLVYGMAAVALLVMVFIRGQNLIGYPPQAYLWFVLLALVPQLLGHSIFNWALGYLSAAFVATALLGEPIGATILAYFLLDERPGMVKLVGAALILFGIYISSQARSISGKQEPA